MRKGMEMGKSRVIALLAVASLVASACGTSTGSASPAASTVPAASVPAASVPAASAPVVGTSPTPVVDTTVYPRAETLYTTGKQWGPPPTWNPLDAGNYATGTLGLQYETLFMYDPLKDVYLSLIH